MTDMKALSAEQKEELAAEYERIVAESADESAEYSLRHYRKMSHIIGERPTPSAGIRRAKLRRTAAALIAAVLLLLAGCTAAYYKDKIGDLFLNIYDTYIKGSFAEDDSANDAKIEEYYVPTYLPDGYELVDDKPGIAVAVSVWENQEGNQMILEQTNIDSGRYFIDNESGQSDVIKTEEYTVYFRNIDGTYRCIWSNEQYAFRLYFEQELSTEEIIRIIEGISPKQK